MIRTLLIDDEEPARDRLRRLLTAHPDVEVVAEAGDGREALEKIAHHGPDLVFLDIEMPVHSGIEVISSLPPPRPQIIFCTAFDSYAVEAFEHNAVDYLLKPVNRQRLSKSLMRIRQTQRQSEDSREIREAGSAQRRLFPGSSAGLPTLDYYGSCRPARGVGGDYYDFIPLPQGNLGFALGDVSGKGVYAGLLMAGLQGRLQGNASRYQTDLEGLFSELNHRLWSVTESSKYATLFYGVYEADGHRFTYLNAGHPPPLMFRSGGEERLESGGIPIGLFPQAAYTSQATPLQPGDVVVLCSDGLLEAESPDGLQFGYEGLVDAVRPHLHLAAGPLHNQIIRQLDYFRRDRELADDLTLVVLKAMPRPPGEDGSS